MNMRKNPRQVVELECYYCHTKFKRFKKEYDRQIRKGRTKWYCNNSCSSKDNPAILKQAQYCKDHPQEMFQRMISSPNYTGKLKDEYTPFRKYILKIKQRNQSFHSSRETEITAEYLKEIWDKQNGICPYTGLKMQLRDYSQPSSPTNASVDRIDSQKGYIKDNIEFVCMSVNFAKHEFSKQEMLDFFNSIKKPFIFTQSPMISLGIPSWAKPLPNPLHIGKRVKIIDGGWKVGEEGVVETHYISADDCGPWGEHRYGLIEDNGNRWSIDPKYCQIINK